MNRTDLFNTIRMVVGDFIEVGVYKGSSSVRILEEASIQSKMFYALDSFKGMDTPSEFDTKTYPKGRLAVPLDDYKEVLKKAYPSLKEEKDYKIHKGYVPKVFDLIPKDVKLSFSYLDVDHYIPTKLGLLFLWERTSEGGVLLCDDYFPDSNRLSSKAINEFIEYYKPKVLTRDPIFNLNQICFIKE